LAAGKEIALAVDTEFQGAETLTIQYAVRAGDEVRVQLYHSPAIPPPPRNCFGRSFANRFPARVVVLPPKVISAALSPARVLADILGLPAADFLSRYEGDAESPLRGYDGKQASAAEPRRLPRIHIKLVGHFLRADLLRAFGRTFYGHLLAPADRSPAVALREGRVIGFGGTGGLADRFADPVVEYVTNGGQLYELRLGTMDTNYVCGPTKLDDLARSYIGVAKDELVTGADKEKMKAVFRDPNRTADAYRYAAQDAIITLLVAQRMEGQHAALYSGFGIPLRDIPPMHGTPGLRVANLILQHARHTAAAGSAILGATDTSPAGLNRIKDLARRGSADSLSDGRVSHYGKQTGDTHGGLLQSRTPYQFFHRAKGQFRDLDLKSCYPAIIRKMVVYFGRPLVLEPGHATWPLKQAIEYLRKHADGDHAWFVKVSGPIQEFNNTLIPSTIDGLTNDNYRGRDRDRAARKANLTVLGRKDRDRLRERIDDRKYTALFTDEVNAGVVTWATWLMIQALPPAARRQYENLRAETIVFYPRKLAAASGKEFDALVKQYRTGRPVDWRQELDLDGMTQTTVEDIDDKYVSLRYPVGQLTDRLVSLREEAGKDTAAGLLYKTLANTVYGVFASPFLPTSNPVAGNVITGTARALAYAMTQSLNAHLVITDGVLYRRDRVPAGTFAARLKHNPDYPLLHTADGPFIDTNIIPEADAEFTDWYVGQVLQFFGVTGRPEYESLFRLHSLSHKDLSDGGTKFDGIFVDGSANYAKLVRTADGEYRVADMKARAFGKRQKERLASWLYCVYRKDRFTRPPRAVRSGRLLGLGDALAQTRRTIASARQRAIVPLGHQLPSLTTYKLVKPSAFVFRTARQRDGILVDWRRLNQKTSCGPELLALRRTFGGSLAAVARKLFELIRRGDERLNRLNIDKLWRPNTVGHQFGEEVCGTRDEERERFRTSLAVAAKAGQLTGLVLDRRSYVAVREASAVVRW
jgi:hypothetical protein